MRRHPLHRPHLHHPPGPCPAPGRQAVPYYASLHNPDATRASRRSARLPALCRAQPSQELERTNALVLYYLHAWCNPCIFDAAFLDLPRISALLVRRLRGATSLPEAMASGLRSVIAGFS